MKRFIQYLTGSVFLLLAAPAFSQPPTEGSETPAPTAPDEKNNPKAPVPGQNSFTEEQAKERLAEEGFVNVMNLQLGEDGVWRADAARNGQPLKVLLDFQGNITTE